MKLSKEQKIGLFATTILIALYILINFLSGRDIFNKTNTYYAVYDNVEGLAVTGPIYIRGLKVGLVEAIEYNQADDHFVVKMRIKGSYALPRNSVAQIYSSDILGSKALRINIGNGSLHLQNRDTIQSATEIGLISLLTDEILPVKEQLSMLLISLNETFANINEVLNEEAKGSIAKSLKNLENTLGYIESISSNLEKSNPEIDAFLSNLNSLSLEITESSRKLNRSLDNIGDITDSLKVADIAGTISSFRDMVEQIQNTEGSIGKLLHSDSLHSSLDSLIDDLNTLIRNINENPKKYIKISIF